jgi:hypothetical protein
MTARDPRLMSVSVVDASSITKAWKPLSQIQLPAPPARQSTCVVAFIEINRILEDVEGARHVIRQE